MQLSVPSSRLVENRSDSRDNSDLTNAMRDVVLNAVGEYFRNGSTADATVTEIWSDTMNADSVADLWLTVVGQTAGAASGAGYRRRVVAKRIGTGAVTFLGAGADVIGVDKEDVAGWDAGFALDAARPGLIIAYVQGAAATDVSWRAHIHAVVIPWE